MNAGSLPTFRYHPDPVGSGSIGPSPQACSVCRRARGFAYLGSLLSRREIEVVCPWCIADGSAAETFGAVFVSSLDPERFDEVVHRTPGYLPWQDDVWLMHCGDAASFIGPIGHEELARSHPDVLQAMAERLVVEGIREEGAWDLLRDLRRDGNATGYLFRCLACDSYLAHWDMN